MKLQILPVCPEPGRKLEPSARRYHAGQSKYARYLALAWLIGVLCVGAIQAGADATPAASPSPASQPNAQSSPGRSSVSTPPGGSDYNPIAGNPGAVNAQPGLGLIGKFLGFGPESGVFIGGVWVANANYQFSGGPNPKTWNTNSLEIVGADVDLEKIIGLKGSEIGSYFLAFDGQQTNVDAGVVTGFDGLPETKPLDRTELYQLWWRQRLFDDKLSIRFGKVVPTFDFNNVTRPVPVQDQSLEIPAVTGLIYTPIFVNPTILGNMPGYYNSAYGLTTTFSPTPNTYATYGVYDGTLAKGRQTGISATPRFSGYYFQIGELGAAWLLGPERLPGAVGLGGWGQTGNLSAGSPKVAIHQNGTEGFYAFGSQRLWFLRPGRDNSGITSLMQFGINNSSTMLASKYWGAGLTAFGLVPNRPADSFGFGTAWSWLNRLPGSNFRSNETILATYYQAHVYGGFFVQPTFTYVPNPGVKFSSVPIQQGENAQFRGVTALTLQSTLLF